MSSPGPSGGLNILALSDPTWDRPIRLAAAALYGAAVQHVRSVPAALARLAAATPHVSHLLVQAGCALDRLQELASFTNAGRRAPAQIILLGNAPAGLPNARIVAQPSADALTRVLAETTIGRLDPNPSPLPASEISDALSRSALLMRYQPIVTVADRAPYALEVLARLQHPALGTLGPAQFVPQLEDAGLAHELTGAVIDCAFADYNAHLHDLNLPLSLNFPLEVLLQESHAALLSTRRRRAGLSPHCLLVELTESQPVAALPPAARERLRQTMLHMRGLGYRLAIDDFGPGMPDRLELFTLPFNLLKLDKLVVTEPGHANLVAQAVATCRRFGLKVIAEGVEDQATWDRMAALGVDYIQGFLVSRPLPAEAIRDWVNEWAAQGH